ncbi:MAG: hypothetical protein AAGU27_23440 [Dehalobacterium sp.]
MKLKSWHIFLIYLFIMTLITMGISFSCFSTTLNNTGGENTVPPDIEFSTWVMDYAGATVSLENMVPGESRIITIWVRNWEESPGEPIKISEYNQSFNLELQTTGNLPLTYTLTENGEGQVDFNQTDYYCYLSATQEFSAQVQETKEYTLTVSWPIEYKDYQYRSELDYIQLRLRAVQS